jgi:NADH-quinone oxidoreductase subunit G/[NiFe] hydrogenase diaphorase moiety small subunit/NADP-reducing hydrogenase subunit HndD
MVAALKRLGFDSVLDTDFTADLTIMEEGTELLTRLKKVLVDKNQSVKLPMATSCSPGWIKYIEHLYPDSIIYQPVNRRSKCLGLWPKPIMPK